MLIFENAQDLARIKLHELELLSNIELSFLEAYTIEFEYGWVFFYQSKEFVERNDEEAMVGGNAPIIVDKYDGNIFITGTNKDIDEYIRIFSAFKKAWLS